MRKMVSLFVRPTPSEPDQKSQSKVQSKASLSNSRCRTPAALQSPRGPLPPVQLTAGFSRLVNVQAEQNTEIQADDCVGSAPESPRAVYVRPLSARSAVSGQSVDIINPRFSAGLTNAMEGERVVMSSSRPQTPLLGGGNSPSPMASRPQTPLLGGGQNSLSQRVSLLPRIPSTVKKQTQPFLEGLKQFFILPNIEDLVSKSRMARTPAFTALHPLLRESLLGQGFELEFMKHLYSPNHGNLPDIMNCSSLINIDTTNFDEGEDDSRMIPLYLVNVVAALQDADVPTTIAFDSVFELYHTTKAHTLAKMHGFGDRVFDTAMQQHCNTAYKTYVMIAHAVRTGAMTKAKMQRLFAWMENLAQLCDDCQHDVMEQMAAERIRELMNPRLFMQKRTVRANPDPEL